MTRSITPEVHGLRLSFLERRLVVDYAYPGTIEVEYAGGVRLDPGKDAGTVELGRFDHAAGAWFDESRWTWNAAKTPSARAWVQNVLAAHEEQRSRSYEHDGEIVLIWHRLPTSTSEQALLAAGFQPSLATWRAAASDRRRAVVRALLTNEAVTSSAPERGQTDNREEIKERAQHAWMRWFAVFQDTLEVGDRTYKVKGRPALRNHELVLILHHSSGASLHVRLDVSKHPLRYPVSVDGSVTLQRDLVAWEDFPTLAEGIGAVLDTRKKAQRAADKPARKGSGRGKKSAEPVRPRELAQMPPAGPTAPRWVDRLVDAFNADAGPQLAFSRRRGVDTDVFVIHAEERPDRILAVVDIQDEQLDDIRWIDDSLTPAQQDELTERLERALAHFEPGRAQSLTRAAIEKFRARALALGADPDRAAGRAGSEEYRWLAESLRELAEPRGADADDLAAWLSARSLRDAAKYIRQFSNETPLDEFLGELWDKLESSIMLSPVERDRGGFFVHPQAIFESDAGPAIMLRETDADGRPRVVPVRLREDCEDDRCLVESDEFAGGERAWRVGIEWDHDFIRELYRKVREFEHNVRTAPDRLADVREMLFWTAAMIDTPRCRGESRRVAEAAFRKAKEHYDRARALVAQGDSAEGLGALHAALRKIAEAAGELAQTCAEGQATLPGTSAELRVEMRAPRMSRTRRLATRIGPARVTASLGPPERPARRRKDPEEYEARDFYLYKGGALCEACGDEVRRQLQARGLAPADPNNEDSYDSEEFPKGPYEPDGADAPAHCDRGRDCLDAEEIDTPNGPVRVGAFLGNPLTDRGEQYVREQIALDKPIAVQIWAPFYEVPGVTLHHVQLALATLPPGGHEALQEWAASDDPSTALLDFVDEQIGDGVITTNGPAAVHEALRLIASEDRLPLVPGGDARAEEQAVLRAFQVPEFDTELLPHLPMGFELVLYTKGTRERAVSIDVVNRETIDFRWYDHNIPHARRRTIKANFERALDKALALALAHAFNLESSSDSSHRRTRRRRRKPLQVESLGTRGAVMSSASPFASTPWPPARAAASGGRGRRGGEMHESRPKTRAAAAWGDISAELERRVAAHEGELVAAMDRLTRIYSGGRFAGKRLGPGTIVVERIDGTPEFPSLVLPNLERIAEGIDVGAAVALVGIMPLEVALAEWVEARGQETPEGDRFMARVEELVAAHHQRRMPEDEFVAKRAALWAEAERAGVAVEIAWRLRKKWGVRTRESPVATSLSPISVRVMPEYHYLLELNLRQIPQDAHASVISRWVRPPHDHIGAGQGAWQNVLELPILDNTTCAQCPFVLGSNLDCDTCRRWVLSFKRPGAPWSAERIGASLYNCDRADVARAAARALEQATRPPLTAAFFEEFAANFDARMAEQPTGTAISDGYREHCRKAVEWLFPQPDFPLPAAEPKSNTRRGPVDAQASGRARIIDTRGLGERTVAVMLAAHGHKGRR